MLISVHDKVYLHACNIRLQLYETTKWKGRCREGEKGREGNGVETAEPVVEKERKEKKKPRLILNTK